jgi:pimeloyl-ACP methyl ester carboxylesterase
MTARRRAAIVLLLAVIVAAVLVARGEAPPSPPGQWWKRAGVEPRYEDLAGVRVRYVRRGEGPALVLLHGFAASVYTWADVIPALAQDHDVIALDFPGFGGSDIPSDLSPALYPATVLALMDRLGVSRATLVGNSLGGAVGVVLAARHPARVRRLVLIDSAGFNLAASRRPLILRAVGWAPVSAALEVLPVRRLMVRGALRQVFHDDSLVTKEKVEEYLAPLTRPGSTAAQRALLARPDVFGLPGLVSEVRVPTLVIWGRHDSWIPVDDADLFVAAIPGSRKVVLEECGHVPQEERPKEVVHLVQEFAPGR